VLKNRAELPNIEARLFLRKGKSGLLLRNMKETRVCRIGRIDFAQAWVWQEALREKHLTYKRSQVP
jgi:hypothetical protein